MLVVFSTDQSPSQITIHNHLTCGANDVAELSRVIDVTLGGRCDETGLKRQQSKARVVFGG